MKIAVIGSTMMDIVSYTDTMPQAGETRRVSGFHIASGGKGANQAIAAAKLGADVVMMTAVGDDMFGEQSLKNFRKNHIDVERHRDHHRRGLGTEPHPHHPGREREALPG